MLIESIKTKNIKWIFKTCLTSNRIAVLIPQFNEFSKKNFIERLLHFKQFAKVHKNLLDVIIIDDGSTDNSLEVIKWFLKNNTVQFSVISISPNSKKIGALYLTTLNIDYDYILFSDFDTDLKDLKYLQDTLEELDGNPLLMGCYFRMIPMKGFSAITRYQQFEYVMHRKWYEYTSREGSVAVMPGAGSLYKHEILVNLLGSHSGLFSGEDRETTALGIKKGFRVIYQKKIRVLTRPPQTIKELILQRVRWNLGYLETINTEKEYYRKKIKSFSIIGIRTVFDMLNIGVLLMLPLILVVLGFLDIRICLLVVGATYLLKLFWIYFISIIGKNEIQDGKTDYMILLLYPVLKVLVEVPSWFIACYKFLVNGYHKRYKLKPINNHHIKQKVYTKANKLSRNFKGSNGPKKQRRNTPIETLLNN